MPPSFRSMPEARSGHDGAEAGADRGAGCLDSARHAHSARAAAAPPFVAGISGPARRGSRPGIERRCKRELDGKDATLAGQSAVVDLAAVGPDGLPADGEPQAEARPIRAALVAGRAERIDAFLRSAAL